MKVNRKIMSQALMSLFLTSSMYTPLHQIDGLKVSSGHESKKIELNFLINSTFVNEEIRMKEMDAKR